MAKLQTPTKTEKKETAGPVHLAFGRENYLIILAGCVLLIVGYLLMSGGASDNPAKFNPEVFSTRRITVAPIVLIIGFLVVLVGIMKKPKAA